MLGISRNVGKASAFALALALALAFCVLRTFHLLTYMYSATRTVQRSLLFMSYYNCGV